MELLSSYRTLCIVALILALASPACCDFAHSASDSILPFLIVGELALFSDKGTGHQEALQGAKALAATVLATELLKHTVREKRPDTDSTTSFPSGHTSAAFSMATVVSQYHPKYSLLAYGAASVIGWSRVEVRSHRWRDVAAGALLGYFVSKQFTKGSVVASPGAVGYQARF